MMAATSLTEVQGVISKQYFAGVNRFWRLVCGFECDQ